MLGGEESGRWPSTMHRVGKARALALSAAWVLIAVVLVLRPPVLGSHTIAAAVRGEAAPAPVVSVVPPHPGATTTAPEAPEVDQRVTRVYWEDLEAGMCIRVPAEDAVDIPVVDCRATHEEEVSVRTVLTGPDAWPGDEALEASAGKKCRPAFADHIGIGYDDSRLELDLWTNDQHGGRGAAGRSSAWSTTPRPPR